MMSFSRFRCALPLFIPKFLTPNPDFIPCYPFSTSRLYSQFVEDNHAVSSFNRMLRMHPTPPIIKFNHILSSLVKQKRYPSAISLFQQLESKGILPDLFTYNILINCCCCHFGSISVAFSVFSKIFKIGFQPNTITLTTLLKGLCLKGEVHKALHFHDKAVALGFHLDQISYGTLIDGLCKIGETRAAMHLLRQVEGKSVQPNTHASRDTAFANKATNGFTFMFDMDFNLESSVGEPKITNNYAHCLVLGQQVQDMNGDNSAAGLDIILENILLTSKLV